MRISTGDRATHGWGFIGAGMGLVAITVGSTLSVDHRPWPWPATLIIVLGVALAGWGLRLLLHKTRTAAADDRVPVIAAVSEPLPAARKRVRQVLMQAKSDLQAIRSELRQVSTPTAERVIELRKRIGQIRTETWVESRGYDSSLLPGPTIDFDLERLKPEAPLLDDYLARLDGVLDAALQELRERDGPYPIKFEAPDAAELDVALEEEHMHPFQFKAAILEAKVSVRNKTTKTKYLLHNEWHVDGPPSDGQHDIDCLRARYEKEKRRSKLPGELSPSETATGWVHTLLPHQPQGGVGGFTLVFEDELGVRYTLRRDRRGGRL